MSGNISRRQIRDSAMKLLFEISLRDDPLEELYEIAEEIEEQYEDCDVEYHNGGQPLYYYLISVE